MVGVGLDPKGLLVEGGATKTVHAREGPCVFSDHTAVTLSTSPASVTGVEVRAEGRRVCPGPLLS